MAATISLPSARHREPRRRALIYFICGNPGLIGFYADFLDSLRGLLDISGGLTDYDVYGRDLLGFSDDDHAPFDGAHPPWDTEGQIVGIYEDVAARRVESRGAESERRPYDFVVLMGHSLGAYIAVEIFHRHMKNPQQAPHLALRHGFLLFPAIIDLARSPRGERVGTLLRAVPMLGTNGHLLARALLAAFPEALLNWILRTLGGFGAAAADVTARWLKSRDGVWQAIHLGQSELRTIREDLWEEELWEAAAEGGGGGDVMPKFFMFYGREDHWVANHIRDAFIDRRRMQGGGTRIVVDEGDIPHAFCTREDMSWLVARLVSEWVKEIDRSHKDSGQ